MTKEKRIKLLEKALEALRAANKGAGLDFDSEAIAKAHDAVLNALRTLENRSVVSI